MKVTTDHLDAVRQLLLRASSQLEDQRKSARAAQELLDQLDGKHRLLQGAFDILAAAYAGDVAPSEAQLDSLPAAAQNALSYVKPAPAPAV